VSIVGAGRVGTAIGLALAQNGYEITAAWSKSRRGRDRAQQLLGAPILEPPDACRAGDIVIVAVPDGAIAEVAKQIAPCVRRGKYVVHTSGGVSIEALAPAREAGGHIGSLHPLMTFPDPETAVLADAAVAVTCEPRDRASFYRIARAWGGRPFPLADEDKPAYHAAAVFASNYVVASIWAADTIFRTIGVKNANPILAPLMRATIENVIARGPAKAITGPVARGDKNTVKKHIATLKERDADVANAYRAFATLTQYLLDHEQHR
jgi:predicted short-subunit dehydrogenase-like oxidoreductase (DUF2520 family)